MASTNNDNVPTIDIPYAVHVDTTPHLTSATAAAAQLPVKRTNCPPVHVVAVPHIVSQQPESEWQIDFWMCIGEPWHCVGAFCFPCVNAAYTASRMGWSAVLAGLVFAVVYVPSTVLGFAPSQDGSKWFSIDADDTGYYSTLNLIGVACSLVFVAATTILRRAVRQFDGIPGSTITDVCASVWCTCCVLSQLSAHTERVNTLLLISKATLPAYHAA